MTKSRLLNASQVSRVNAALKMLGFAAITPTDDAPGCYVASIVQQYRCDLDEREVLAVIEYAMCTTIASHSACPVTLREIMQYV